MAKLQVYSVKGRKTGIVDFPKDLVAKENMDLLTQAIRVYENRSHKGTSKVKTRGEISATTAKMYRQKGTGNARHGSRKAPLFKGGGVAHGPKGVKRVLELPRNLKDTALKVALNLKVGEGRMVVVDKLTTIKKTKDAQMMVKQVSQNVGLQNIMNTRVVLGKGKKELVKFFRNIHGLHVDYWRKLNAAEVYLSNLIILDKDSLKENRSENPETQKLAAQAKTAKTKSSTKTSIKSTTKKTKTTKRAANKKSTTKSTTQKKKGTKK